MAAAQPPAALAPPQFTIALREQRTLFLSQSAHFREIREEVRSAIQTTATVTEQLDKVAQNFVITESRVNSLGGALSLVGKP